MNWRLKRKKNYCNLAI